MSKLEEKPSALKREHPALQKLKFINFFLCLLVVFALLDPDPDESGDLIEFRSNPDDTDPDPQHWRKRLFLLFIYLASVVDEIADDTGNAYGVHQACPRIRFLPEKKIN
jgi:hypothetical protein